MESAVSGFVLLKLGLNHFTGQISENTPFKTIELMFFNMKIY